MHGQLIIQCLLYNWSSVTRLDSSVKSNGKSRAHIDKSLTVNQVENDLQYAGLDWCVASRGKFEERVRQDESSRGLPDYPIYTAQDTLGCLLSRSCHRDERHSQYMPLDH